MCRGREIASYGMTGGKRGELGEPIPVGCQSGSRWKGAFWAALPHCGNIGNCNAFIE